MSDWLQEQLDNPRIAEEIAAERLRVKIADEIYNAREKAGLTQAQLAQMIGSSQSAVARMESANYDRLSVTTLRKIARALDLDIEIKFKRRKASKSVTAAALPPV
jgi:transcriptional regulator with XRE-family HTH domain